MKKIIAAIVFISGILLVVVFITCKRKNAAPQIDLINAMNLKRGQVVLCSRRVNNLAQWHLKRPVEKMQKKILTLL
ncbi:hypothetical protein [Ferruginibacter sp. SUN106]|uniref:hypothetical protein n=1 Tax=Ferruginibacter sp. SUN106 TaxID=2978348 RepID=UPI003D35BEF1